MIKLPAATILNKLYNYDLHCTDAGCDIVNPGIRQSANKSTNTTENELTNVIQSIV